MFNDGLDMFNELDKSFTKKYDHKHVRAHSQMYDQATRLMTTKDLEAFNLKKGYYPNLSDTDLTK